jgi:uncharacterized protein (DUF983 family)
MYCPSCREGNPDGAKFCGSCGKKMPSSEPDGLDKVFKWIGITVVGLFVFGLLFA